MRNITDKESKKLVTSNLKYIGIIDDKFKSIIYNCEKHGVVTQRFDVHVRSLGCSKCSHLKVGKFNKDYINELILKKQIKYKYNIEDKCYTNQDKIEIFCDLHGKFTQIIHNHFYLDNNCPKCSYLKKIVINPDIEVKLSERQISIIKYEGYRLESTFLCDTHGEFKAHIENVKKYGCPKCAKSVNLNNEKLDFIEKSKIVWESLIKFDYSTMQFNGQRYKMRIFSNETGWIHQTAGNHLRGILPKSNSSTGEFIIENILSSNNICFSKQMTFDKCINIKKLRFDFYLPEIKTCIEYNGIQHYQPIAKFGGVERHEYQLKNDNIKKSFCDSNLIKLIVISYKDSIVDKLKSVIC